jgi:hypothetical protein
MSPEEARDKAYNTAIKSGEDKTAAFLKSKFENLTVIYNDASTHKDLAIPTDVNEYTRMAKELIDKRQFNAATKSGGMMTITLDDLDKKDDELELGIKKSKGAKSLQELVPTREQLQTTAKAIASGVEEETGSIGFLGGATVMAALTGLFKWIFSGFKGGFDGLKQTIAGVTAENMQHAVGNNLERLRASRPDMAHILTRETIDETTQTVRNEVLTQGGVAIRRPREVTLEDVKFDSIADNQLAEARTKIHDEILQPKGGTPLHVVIEDELNAKVEEAKKSAKLSDFASFLPDWKIPGVITDLKAPSKETIQSASEKMAEVIATSASAFATDAKSTDSRGRRLSDPSVSKQDYARAVSDAVGEALVAYDQEGQGFGLPMNLSDPDKGHPGKTNLDAVKDKVREKLMTGENYQKLHMASTLATVKATQAARELADKHVDSASRATVSGGSSHQPDGTQLTQLTQGGAVTPHV